MTEYTTKDLEFELANTWIEENGSGFHRVAVVNYFCPSILQSTVGSLMQTHGQQFRDRIADKLKNEMGIEHGDDYIFGDYTNPVMKDGKWLVPPPSSDFAFMLRFREDQHFIMFKIHYQH